MNDLRKLEGKVISLLELSNLNEKEEVKEIKGLGIINNDFCKWIIKTKDKDIVVYTMRGGKK